MKTPLVAPLAVVVLCGAWLRFAGLSHDLSAGYVYHPDTAKQIHAAERFLTGRSSYHFGHPDYDGYPYFNSHLVEYVCRAYRFAANEVLNLVGAPRLGPVERLELYWVTRVLNSLLSTLAIVVLFWLGLRASRPATGLMAATFLALSPVDVVSSHDATSDTTAAFFALLSVLFSLRIYDLGGWLDSALAGFFATAGFATKYHAGIAILAAVFAHCLRRVRTRERLTGLGLVAAGAAASLFVTIPTFLAEPGQSARDILGFLRHTSTIDLPAYVERAFHARFLFSLRRNAPILADTVGPHLLAVALAGLVLPIIGWRRRLMLASVPVVYFLIEVPFRPMAPPVYHTLMTPLVFLFAAGTLMWTPPWAPGARRLWRVAAAALTVASAAYLLRHSWREDFFFSRQDTRRMAQQWTEQNVPSSFGIETNGYTFTLDPPPSPLAGPPGSLFLTTNLRPLKPPPGAFFLKRFHLEDDPLAVFRNPSIDMFLETPVLKKGFRVPVLHGLPARSGNDFIFESGPEFYQREKEFLLEPGSEIDKTLVTPQPLADALLVLRGGEFPTTVTISFGNAVRRMRLGPSESRWVSVDTLQRSFASRAGANLYRLTLASSLARSRVTLATTPLGKGLALYTSGFYREAYPWLERAAGTERDPEIAALAIVSRELAGAAASEAERARLDEIARGLADLADPHVFDERYAGTLLYLDALQYAFSEAEALAAEGLRIVGDDDASNGRAIRAEPYAIMPSISVPLEMLEPGHYAVKARLKLPPDAPAERLRFRLTDGDRVEHNRREFDCCSARASGFVTRRFDFEIPYFEPRWNLSVELDPTSSVVLDSVEIVPDLAAEARALERLRRLVLDRDPAPAIEELGAYRPMMILADRLAAQNDTERAFALYRAAVKLRPDEVPPLEAIARIEGNLSQTARREAAASLAVIGDARQSRVLHAAEARFQSDLRLVGYRIREADVVRGETFGLNLYWELPASGLPAHSLSVWVHFFDKAGQLAFQGDHALLDDLRRRRDSSKLRPAFYEIPVPESIRPGFYEVAVGLDVSERSRKLALVAAAGRTRGHGVVLPIRVRVR